MKPARFDYHAPETLSEALDLLQQHGDQAKVLAGGQSLMPLMAMRLARPPVIVDINRLSSLGQISPSDDGGITIGALTRQRAVERSDLVQQRNPLLSAIMPQIGHFQIRNRGTVGGSLAHADPSAELPAFAVAVDAGLTLERAGGQREVAARDFFVTYFATAIEPAELLTEVHAPGLGPGWGWGLEEVCRRQGDFALVGAISLVHLGNDGACDDGRVVIFGVGGAPVNVAVAGDMLRGTRGEITTLQEVAGAVSDEMDPDADLHASAQYRKEVAGVMARRSLVAAFARARGESV